MNWQVYRLVCQAKSPVHIGYRSLRFIQRTRYYIPGRAFWGALTANLTRRYFLPDKDEVARRYSDVGAGVNEHIKLTYLYPALKADEPLLPQFTSEGLRFGGYTQEEFEKLFIRSWTQTAVEPGNITAEEGSLHETEFISPVVDLSDKQSPVLFVGYIAFSDETKINSATIGWVRGDAALKTALQEIFIGGERRYGMGRLVLLPESRVVKPDKNGSYPVFGHELTLDNDKAILHIRGDSPIPAHLDITGCPGLKGDIEALVGREWGEDGGRTGAGQKISKAHLSWVPGSILLKEDRFEIKDHGLLDKEV